MQNNLLTELSLQQLQQAVAIREKIEDLERELSRVVVGRTLGARKALPARQRKLSAATRTKVSAMMKANSAKRKGKNPVSKAPALKAKGGSRGAPLKERIVGTLKAAGKPGVSIKDLASNLGKSYGNISVWFHTTAKGIKEIKKVEPGRFAWVS